MRQPARNWELVALKWRSLAERRRGHLVDLYKSGRWKRYYTDEELLTEMRAADAIARRWGSIAPLPEERAAQAATEKPAAA